MHENHIIPVSNGLFDHRDRIGSAIWEFLWCIDATTSEEVDESGTKWGLVHNGVPVKHERIAEETGTSERTVQRNMTTLKKEGYIQTVRVARGEIIKVTKNKKDVVKKRYATNVVSVENDMPDVEHHSDNDTPIMEHHEERHANNGVSDVSDTPNVASLKDLDLKDLKDLNSTTTITTTIESASPESTNRKKLEMEKLLIIDAYCLLHKKLEFHVREKEREVMGKMIAGGVLSPFIIQTMTKLFDNKRKREEEDGIVFAPPTTFKYYENAIYEAWRVEKSITSDVPSSGVALGSTRKTKQQKEMDELDQIIAEGKRNGPNGGS